MNKLILKIRNIFLRWPAILCPCRPNRSGFGNRGGVRTGLCIITALLILSGISCFHNPASFDEGKWRGEITGQKVEGLYDRHIQDERFFNPWMPQPEEGFSRLLKWRFSKKEEYRADENSYLPKVIPYLKERIQARPQGDFIAWIGHATFFIRTQGEYWLSDPMFSERALLPKRKTSPAITAKEIGEITDRVNVILSHNHYDHLDKNSLKDLPRNTRFFVPLGLGSYIKKLTKGQVVEMDWWQTIEAGKGIKIQFLPAQHWSRRISQGVNQTLWGSFMLSTPETTIYYGGDSGYFIGYKEIGLKYPKIEYALLPTTAYHPRWFMHYAHMDIKETLAAFQDLRARYFIPTQWGTFRLGNDPVGYPALDLKRQIKEKNLDPSQFLIMDIGQILPLPHKQ